MASMGKRGKFLLTVREENYTEKVSKGRKTDK
jgi:hypothetical protein